jgi:hypothetical protein
MKLKFYKVMTVPTHLYDSESGGIKTISKIPAAEMESLRTLNAWNG